MSKKFGKFLLFSAVAGAAAYGAWQYLSQKEKSTVLNNQDDEDFDDFNEDLDEDVAPQKERSYVSLNLDKAEALATEAFHKAKEVITDSVQKVKESVIESASQENPPVADVTDQTTEVPVTEAEPASEASASGSDSQEASLSEDSSTEDPAAASAGTTASPITEEFPFE